MERSIKQIMRSVLSNDAGGLNTPISEPIYTQNRIVRNWGKDIPSSYLRLMMLQLQLSGCKSNDPGKLLYIIDLALSEEVHTGYKSWKHPELLEPKDRTRGVRELGRSVLDRDVRDARLRPAREADSFTTGQLSRADLDKYNIYRRKLAPLISEEGFIDFLEDPGKRNKEENVIMGMLLKSGLYEGARPGLLSGSAAHETRMMAEPSIDYEAATQPLPSWIQWGGSLPGTSSPAIRGAGIAGGFVRKGSDEIIEGIGDAVNLGRT